MLGTRWGRRAAAHRGGERGSLSIWIQIEGEWGGEEEQIEGEWDGGRRKKRVWRN
jgi:hypothetical protein